MVRAVATYLSVNVSVESRRREFLQLAGWADVNSSDEGAERRQLGVGGDAGLTCHRCWEEKEAQEHFVASKKFDDTAWLEQNFKASSSAFHLASSLSSPTQTNRGTTAFYTSPILLQYSTSATSAPSPPHQELTRSSRPE